MITYSESLDRIDSEKLQGFFVGWPHPPSPQTHLEILKKSAHIVLAVDTDTDQIIGFVNALSDDVLAAYIPLLEVLPDYQERGIGSELMRRLLKRLDGLYMIDLVCDEKTQPFYARFGLKRMTAMMIRDFDHQAGIGGGEER